MNSNYKYHTIYKLYRLSSSQVWGVGREHPESLVWFGLVWLIIRLVANAFNDIDLLLVHWFIYWLIDSLIHWLIHWLIDSLTSWWYESKTIFIYLRLEYGEVRSTWIRFLAYSGSILPVERDFHRRISHWTGNRS